LQTHLKIKLFLRSRQPDKKRRPAACKAAFFIAYASSINTAIFPVRGDEWYYAATFSPIPSINEDTKTLTTSGR
jgi:hypothetical protein